MRKIAIFDLDGTLLDSIPDISFCANEALARAGLPGHPQDAYKAFLGMGPGTLITKMMTPEDYERYGAQISETYMALYREKCSRAGALFPGTLPMLGRLREAGFLLGALSNKPHEMVCTLLPPTFGETLDLAVGQKEEFPRKPDPTSLFGMIEELGGSPETTVYVGDSEVDILTGQNAKVFTIAVTWGNRSKDLLESYHPDLMVDTMEDLEKNILFVEVP